MNPPWDGRGRGRGRGLARGQSRPVGPSANQQGSPRPSANQQGSPRPSANQQGSPRPSENQQGSPRPSADQQGFPRLSANQQKSTRPSANQQGSQRPSANQQGSQRPSGNVAPRLPAPTRPWPAVGNAPQVPKPQQSTPVVTQSSMSTEVEQIKSGLGIMGAGDTPVPIGRGAVRGRQPIAITEHYRSPRPESSKNKTGKQGTLGNPVSLISNYFPIKSYTNWTLFQYRVDFSPSEDKVMVQRGLLSVHKDFLGAYIFDGSMMFSSTKYKSKKFELTSKRISDEQIILITVTFTSVIEPGDYANIQVYNILLRNCLRHLELKLVGRNYYDPLAKIRIDSLRLQLWPGYETTIGMFDSGLLLRSEITTKVMREETVYDLLQEFMRDSQRDDEWFNKFQAAVIGTTVLTTYNNQTYRIDDVDKTCNITSTFKKKDETSMSYIDYYLQKWNIKLKHYGQPLLISKKKKVYSNMEDKTEHIYLIPELCTLTGVPQSVINDKMNMRKLAEYTRVNPHDRITRYNNFMSRLLSTTKSVEVLKNWNLEPDRNLVKIKARVLNPQEIACNTHTYTSGARADWSNNLRSSPMYNSAKVTNWVIITPEKYLRDVNEFTLSIKRVADGMSFYLPKPIMHTIRSTNGQSYVVELNKVISTTNPSLIMCVIMSTRGDTYSVIKRYLCVQRAVPSQLILISNIQKNNLSVATKVAVQMNCKIGGAPWLVKIPTKNMLIIGFDVCHDKQKQKKSYGALVASINDLQTVYYSSVTEHTSGEELSNFFVSHMLKVLTAYRKLNNTLPLKIVIYRDGVGDGQLSYVHKVELSSIKKVCKEFYQGIEPQLAFIIVKKRISTRFFTNTPNERPGNPMPGTVVDTVVTDPTMYDFFLVSQHVNQGTVTPIHYNVIEDTLKDWSPDRMQMLTFKLTHMYFNWSGTVRVPALCQYAHKLAFLSSQILQATPNTGLNELLFFL